MDSFVQTLTTKKAHTKKSKERYDDIVQMLGTGTRGVKTRHQKAAQEEQKIAVATKASKAPKGKKNPSVDFAKEIFDMLK